MGLLDAPGQDFTVKATDELRRQGRKVEIPNVVAADEINATTALRALEPNNPHYCDVVRPKDRPQDCDAILELCSSKKNATVIT